MTVPPSPNPPDEQASRLPTERLQGIVERVTYHAEDSGYTVARLKAPGERDLITILGRFPDIHAGQTLRLTGNWREHPKYGKISRPLTNPHRFTPCCLRWHIYSQRRRFLCGWIVAYLCPKQWWVGLMGS